jgi:hypothetical protein
MYCVIYWTYFAIHLEKILKAINWFAKTNPQNNIRTHCIPRERKERTWGKLGFQRRRKFYQSFVQQILLRKLDQIGKSKVDSFQSPVVMLDWENMNSNWQALIVPDLEAENKFVSNMLPPNYNRYQWVTSRHYALKYSGWCAKCIKKNSM